MLENENIKLRALEPEDLELLYVWENDSVNWYAGCLRLPYSKFNLKQYILSVDQDIYESKQLRFVVESKVLNRAVGMIDLYDFDYFNSRVAVGVFIAPDFQKKAFARASLKLLDGFVFDYLNINQLYAHIAENNESSKILFENSGFTRSAVLKNWMREGTSFLDVLLYQRLRSQFQSPFNSSSEAEESRTEDSNG